MEFDSSSVGLDNEGPMKVTLALLADAANVSKEGKLNILGTFDNINASKFPARHPEMQLVLRLEASPAEANTKKRLELKVMDADGKQVGGANAEISVPPAQTGRYISMQAIMRITDAVFPKPGDYVYAVLIDGRTEAEVQLQLLEQNGGG